jgi:hypothetical protein
MMQEAISVAQRLACLGSAAVWDTANKAVTEAATRLGLEFRALK